MVNCDYYLLNHDILPPRAVSVVQCKLPSAGRGSFCNLDACVCLCRHRLCSAITIA